MFWGWSLIKCLNGVLLYLVVYRIAFSSDLSHISHVLQRHFLEMYINLYVHRHLRLSGMWCLVVWQSGANIPGESATLFFRVHVIIHHSHKSNSNFISAVFSVHIWCTLLTGPALIFNCLQQKQDQASFGLWMNGFSAAVLLSLLRLSVKI